MFHTLNKKVSIFLILLGIVYLILSFRLPPYQYVPIDADAVPIGLGILLILLSCVLFFQSEQQPDEGENDNIQKKDLPYVLGVIGLTVLYILSLEVIGFIIATFLFIFICSFFLGFRRHIINLIVSIGMPFIIYLLFTSFLKIQLPSGVLPF